MRPGEVIPELIGEIKIMVNVSYGLVLESFSAFRSTELAWGPSKAFYAFIHRGQRAQSFKARQKM